MLPHLRRCVDDLDPADVHPVMLSKGLWPFSLYVLGGPRRLADARGLMTGTFDSLEAWADWLEESYGKGGMRPRGSADRHPTFAAADDCLHMARCIEILLAEEPPAPAALAALPPVPDAAMLGASLIARTGDFTNMLPRSVLVFC